MTGVISAGDATVIVAIIVAGSGAWTAAISSRRNGKETRANGGASMRDAVDRIERHVDGMSGTLHDVAADIHDLKSQVRSHGERLARLEKGDAA